MQLSESTVSPALYLPIEHCELCLLNFAFYIQDKQEQQVGPRLQGSSGDTRRGKGQCSCELTCDLGNLAHLAHLAMTCVNRDL